MEIELFDGTILEFPEGTSDAVIDRAARQETISRRGANGGLTQIGTFADDGRILRRPDGSLTAVSAGGSTSDQATINRIMEGGSFAEISQDRFDNKIIDENKGIARLNEFVRGVPFVGEYVDEAVGKISPKAGEAMRRTTEAMQRQRPGETTALNVGGGIAGSVPLALAGGPALIEKARGMGRGARVAIGGLLGAIGGGTEGAISGYGSGENPEDRLANARSRGIAGGALGGILGGSGPLVADGAGALAEKAGNVYRGIGNYKV